MEVILTKYDNIIIPGLVNMELLKKEFTEVFGMTPKVMLKEFAVLSTGGI